MYNLEMIDVIIYSSVSVVIVSLISLIGLVVISLKDALLKKIIFFLIPLAVGALLGDAFIQLIPNAIEQSTNNSVTSLYIIFGIMTFFILEKYLYIHHEHSVPIHVSGKNNGKTIKKPVGKLILVSDGFHNFIDGIIIGVSYLISIPVGIATTISIILHEIPQEMADFGILLYSGYTRKQALFYNFLSALTAVVGVFVVFALGDLFKSLLSFFIPFAAGIFIYIASADLIPELHKRKSMRGTLIELSAMFLGIFIIYILLFLEK